MKSAFAPSELRRDRDTILGLAENRAAGRRRNPLKLDEWCIADRLDDSVAKLHRRVILKREWSLND